MFNSTLCRDTIRLKVSQPGETTLSVKCEKKGTELFNILKWFLPYKRDHERENMLMVNTTEQLKADRQAKVEWLGKWRPDTDSP